MVRFGSIYWVKNFLLEKFKYTVDDQDESHPNLVVKSDFLTDMVTVSPGTSLIQNPTVKSRADVFYLFGRKVPRLRKNTLFFLRVKTTLTQTDMGDINSVSYIGILPEPEQDQLKEKLRGL